MQDTKKSREKAEDLIVIRPDLKTEIETAKRLGELNWRFLQNNKESKMTSKARACLFAQANRDRNMFEVISLGLGYSKDYYKTIRFDDKNRQKLIFLHRVFSKLIVNFGYVASVAASMNKVEAFLNRVRFVKTASRAAMKQRIINSRAGRQPTVKAESFGDWYHCDGRSKIDFRIECGEHGDERRVQFIPLEVGEDGKFRSNGWGFMIQQKDVRDFSRAIEQAVNFLEQKS